MNQTEFLSQAMHMLTRMHDALEVHYNEGEIDELEMQGGILTIADENGHTIVVNIHEASQQIWLASASTGGMHFDFDEPSTTWKTASDETLVNALNQALEGVFSIHITLA